MYEASWLAIYAHAFKVSLFAPPRAVQSASGSPSLHSSVTRGHITDWIAYEQSLKAAFGALGLESTDQALLLTEPVLHSNANREKLCQLLFETLDVPGVYFGRSAALALKATGQHTGLVVEVNFDSTSIVPIYHGFLLSKHARRFEIGSKDVTKSFVSSLASRGTVLATPADFDALRSFREQLVESMLIFSITDCLTFQIISRQHKLRRRRIRPRHGPACACRQCSNRRQSGCVPLYRGALLVAHGDNTATRNQIGTTGLSD